MDSLQLIQELNATSLQHFPPESEHQLHVLCVAQRKLAEIVLILCEERRKKHTRTSVVADKISLLLNGDAHDPFTMPTVESLIMSHHGSPGMIGAYALELLWASGANRPSRRLNLVVAEFLSFKISLTDGIPVSLSKFQQECRKDVSEDSPSHPLYPHQKQRVEVWMGAINEAIEECESFPVNKMAMSDLRAAMEAAINKPDHTVADINTAQDIFLMEAASAELIGPIPEASVFAARQQLQAAAPLTKASPLQSKPVAKTSDAVSGSLPVSSSGKDKSKSAHKDGKAKAAMPKTQAEYQEMLRKMPPELRIQHDRHHNHTAMVIVNDFFKKQKIDASKYLQKAKLDDGTIGCYLKKSTTGTNLIFIEKALFDKMDQKTRSALRRLSALSRKYHGIAASKVDGPVDNQVKLVMAATRSSKLAEEQFDELAYFEDEFEEDDDNGTAASSMESLQNLNSNLRNNVELMKRQGAMLKRRGAKSKSSAMRLKGQGKKPTIFDAKPSNYSWKKRNSEPLRPTMSRS